jgi:hypothetical protein
MIAALRRRRAGRIVAFGAALACTTVVGTGPAAADHSWVFEPTCGGGVSDAISFDESHDLVKIPDARQLLLRPPRTTPIKSYLLFPDLTTSGYDLYCVRVVVDIVHPDRSDLRVELTISNGGPYQVVYENGKPGQDLHLSVDRMWTEVGWVKLRITDLDPGDTGALVYWRAEGHFTSGPAAG